MHSESGDSINLEPLTTPTKTTALSRRLSSSNQLSGLLATSRSKDYRLNADDLEHARITMKTRVAVRDKTPHRFQVVPLRDMDKLTALETGRPSQLALPPASHTLLRSASIRRQTYSQVKPVMASSHSQLNSTQNKYDMVMLGDSETLAIPCAEVLAIPALALSPSFKLDNKGGSHLLAEQDTNLPCTKSTTNKFESFVTTPTTTPQSYDASHHTHVQNPVELFSDHSPFIQTTSKSLDLVSCSNETYPKISRRNAPEHIFESTQSSIIGSKSPRKKRTRSENILRVRDNNQRDNRNGPTPSAVTKDNYDLRMTKRHAIYTQSLYVPFLELPNYFPGGATQNRVGHHRLFGVHPNENISGPDRICSTEMSSQAFASDSGADDRSNSSARYFLPDFVESAPSEEPLQVLTLALAVTPHHRGLNYHRLSRVYPLSAEARLHIMYPQIVREMFTDIDRAIHEWRYI